jgi:sodium/hydrogen antiporter
MIVALITIAVILIAYGVVSGSLERRGITSAMALTAAGIVVGTAGLGLVNIELESAAAERFCELALVFLLFSDATRIDLIGLRRHLVWPGRLLVIGLPLTMIAGLALGLVILPGIALSGAFLLTTMLSSTDAALGQRVVSDEAVPVRVRQALDVESGLNDGIAVPFFLVAVDIALAQLSTGVTGAIIGNMVQQIGGGLLVGVVVGSVAGAALRVAEDRGWVEGLWRTILPLVAAFLAYLAALQLGGSGFIAAFVGGMMFGQFSRLHGAAVTGLNEDVGGVLGGVVWVGFGALAIGQMAPNISWPIVVYAILSLTVVRMIPVAIALAGTGAERPTVAFMGWFGPRGLASIVFALLAVESGVPDTTTLLTTVTLTVLLSVFLHGLSSLPLVAAYSSWYAAHSAADPAAAEAAPTAMSRLRRDPGPAGPGLVPGASDAAASRARP